MKKRKRLLNNSGLRKKNGNDLTGAERKAFAAEVGRLILKLSQNSHNDEILNENKPANENWLGEMGKSSGTPTQTLYRWWDNFCKETG